jgi:hypothetical protein
MLQRWTPAFARALLCHLRKDGDWRGQLGVRFGFAAGCCCFLGVADWAYSARAHNFLELYSLHYTPKHSQNSNH